ncbi:helix-turn-helix domain-containing protein [Deinococcus misasensis]|uniref:helix-turn-helix domain-containing protein n=1 Tax=Deinococcus misasensis TaxID=392413 RepID=UPI0005577B67|nr:helix-turn-helix domain-containing protein [Deinococcus misasensis]
MTEHPTRSIKLMLNAGRDGKQLIQRGFPRKLVYNTRQEYIDARGFIRCSELATMLGITRAALWATATRRGMGKLLGLQLFFNEDECELLTNLYTVPEGYVPIKRLGNTQVVWGWFHRQHPEHKHHLKWCTTPTQTGGWYVSPEGQTLFKNRTKKTPPEEVASLRQSISAMRSKGMTCKDIAKTLGCSEAKIFWHLRRMKKEAL